MQSQAHRLAQVIGALAHIGQAILARVPSADAISPAATLPDKAHRRAARAPRSP